MLIVVQIIAAWLLADFIAGVVHWIEDRYLDETQSFEFAQGVASDNQLHHAKPTAMLLNTPWENMRSAAVFAWPVGLLLAIVGAPLWLWLGIVFSSMGNLIHRFAHMPRRQLPRWIRGLQEFGVFISPELHDIHHRRYGQLITKGEADRSYCPMSDLLNPLLDRIRFWGGMESALRLVGIRTIDMRAAVQ